MHVVTSSGSMWPGQSLLLQLPTASQISQASSSSLAQSGSGNAQPQWHFPSL